MEMALMQQSALRSLPSAAVAGASCSQRCGGCGNSGAAFCILGPRRGLSSPGWNWRAGREPSRRGLHPARSSGGSRRDEAKQVAKSQRRRSRHVKGVTPTKPELFDALQAEEEADEELERSGEDFESALEANASSNVDDTKEESNYPSNGKAKGESEPNQDVSVEEERWDQASDQASDTSGTRSGVEEIVDAGEDTYVIKYFPDGKGGSKAARERATDTGEDLTRAALDTATDVSSSVARDAQEVGDSVRENAESTSQEVGEAVNEVSDVVQDTAEEVTDVVQDTAEEVGSTVQDTAEEVGSTVQDTVEEVTSTVQEVAESTGESLSEAGDDVRESFEELSEELPSAAAEIGDTIQETAQEVVDTAAETVQEVEESLEEAGGAVSESLDEIKIEAQKAFNEGERYTREQLKESRKEIEGDLSSLGNQLEEAGDRAGQALEKVSNEAEISLKNVQESLATLIEDSAKASGTIGNEALRLGEVVLKVAGEAAGFQGTKEEFGASNGTSAGQGVKERPKTDENKSNKGSKPPTKVNQEVPGTRSKSSQPKEKLEEDIDLYKGLKVTVAGASGRTGRLLVEELARKGVSVRALVRDKNKSEARNLGKLNNVEVVRVDLYKYESVKKALGDSNVVISAVGARSFAFDPIGTYQAEFEGVKNLVAAAKNKEDFKKFVFITSLGVTFLQIVPLLFWKKQSELYLQRSGLDYTIIRPGGLTNGSSARESISIKPADTQFGGSISRQKVAEVSVAALITPEASEKIVEIVSGGKPGRSFSDLFGSV